MRSLAQIGAQRRRRRRSAWTASSRRRIGSARARGAASARGQQTAAGAGHGAVDRGQQAALAVAGEARQQLEIAPGRGIDHQVAAGRLAARRGEARQAALLGQLDVAEQRAARAELGAREGAEAVQRGDPEARLEAALAGQRIELALGQRRQPLAELAPQRPQRVGLEQPLGQQELARLDPGELGGERAVLDRRGQELAGRDVEPGERQGLLAAGERGEEIVAARLEQAVLGQRAGRDQADDRAPDERLAAAPAGLGRVLGLLADRDLEALPDQALEVALGAVHRHAAHRDVVALMAAALGERDVERRRCRLRVLEEQLVEVAHPEEQQALGMLRLERLILGDHRRGGGCWRAAGGAASAGGWLRSWRRAGR